MSEISDKYVIKIDTTKRDSKSISLLKDGILVDSKNGDFDVVSEVKSILIKNNLDLKKDVSEIIPNVGPGSFTGIKVGITIANILNWVVGNDKTYEPNYGGDPNITMSNK